MYRSKDRHTRRRRRVVTLIVVAVALVAVLVASIPLQRTVSSDMTSQATASIRQSVLDAAVQCYAIEGAYPSDVSYLERYYGLQVDSSRYIVSYQTIGSNVAPDVQVLVRGQS